jgi:hypothetical protein
LVAASEAEVDQPRALGRMFDRASWVRLVSAPSTAAALFDFLSALLQFFNPVCEPS